MKKFAALVAFLGCVLFAGACSSEDVQDATDRATDSAKQVAGEVSDATGDLRDNGYIEALKTQDITFGDRTQQIETAKLACTELSDGTSLADTTKKVADSAGIDENKARALINTGVPVYCTQNAAKLAGN
jgi:uncharacterized protein YjbJ (UPF0337 family)